MHCIFVEIDHQWGICVKVGLDWVSDRELEEKNGEKVVIIYTCAVAGNFNWFITCTYLGRTLKKE